MASCSLGLRGIHKSIKTEKRKTDYSKPNSMLGMQGKYHMYCMMTKSFSFIDHLTTTERAKSWGFYRFGDVHVEFKTFSRLKTIK